MTQITKLIQNATENAHNHGWYIEWNRTSLNSGVLSVGEALALIHSEVSEALEEVRDDNKDTFSIEIADVFIRLFHLCGDLNIDIEKAIETKMKKNTTRAKKHGRKIY